jgi:ribosomal protein S18 acetylase RimI-like enzyme
MPQAGLEIRRAVAADLDAVRRCAEAAYALYVPRIGGKPAPMVADFAFQIEAGQVHVCVEGDSLLGYIVIYPRDGHLHVENVAVFPELQGRGIGRVLLAHAESEARRAGIAAIELYTNQHMTENLSFYPHLGYRETGRGEEAGFARVFYRKEL